MCLLYLVEQYDRIRLAAHGFRKLTAFVITYISRRRSDKPAHGMLLLILAHVDTRHHILIVKEVFGESLGQLGLSYTGGSKKYE